MTVRPIDVMFEIDRRAESVGVPLKTIDTSQARLTAIADDVRSLWNVGSIFRSADGAGFDTLFLCGITGTPPRKEIAKTSLGSEDHVNWYYAPTTAALIPILQQQGFYIVGLEFTPDSSLLTEVLQEKVLTQPLCLCVGNEVAGLSAETLAQCDIVCHLPMRGFKESLNVAVAFGIAAYAIAEQLQ